MVAGFAFTAGESLGGGLISTVTDPLLDAARQETSKIFPFKKIGLQLSLVNFRRGKISEEQFLELASRQGLNEEQARRMIFASKFFPSPQDLVTFVVKEAFTPEIIEDLTKGEPTPDKFKEEMIKLGADEEVSDWFWTAHYDPLGRRDFEEMFQRLNKDALEFKKDDLEALGLKQKDIEVDLDFLRRMLRIRDIYPGLRDRVAMIAYKPISRIDIRRIDDFGLLPEEQLEFRNREFGYSPADAKLLANWTTVNNALKDILPQLKRGAINFDDAVQMLIDAGADADNAKRLIERKKPSIKIDRMEKWREKLINKVFTKLVNEKFDNAQGVKFLTALGLDKDEANVLVDLTKIIEVAE